MPDDLLAAPSSQDIANQIQQAMNKRERDNNVGVSLIAYHTHTGTDSPRVDIRNIENFPSQTGNSGKVLTTNGQTLSFAASTGQFAFGADTRGAGTGTGTQTFSTSFQPKFMMFQAWAIGNDGGWSVGGSTGTSDDKVTAKYYNGTNWIESDATTIVIDARPSGGATSRQAAVTAIAATGFTLTWSADSVNTHFMWFAFG